MVLTNQSIISVFFCLFYLKVLKKADGLLQQDICAYGLWCIYFWKTTTAFSKIVERHVSPGPHCWISRTLRSSYTTENLPLMTGRGTLFEGTSVPFMYPYCQYYKFTWKAIQICHYYNNYGNNGVSEVVLWGRCRHHGEGVEEVLGVY